MRGMPLLSNRLDEIPTCMSVEVYLFIIDEGEASTLCVAPSLDRQVSKPESKQAEFFHGPCLHTPTLGSHPEFSY